MNDRYNGLREAASLADALGRPALFKQMIANCPETIRALLAERDRYREALEHISSLPESRSDECSLAARKSLKEPTP